MLQIGSNPILRLMRPQARPENAFSQEVHYIINHLSPLGRASILPFYKRVMKQLSPQRYMHVLRVLTLADRIAQGNDFSQAEWRATTLAAILHDVARELSPREMYALVPPELECEKACHLTLHGKAGSSLARKWGVRNSLVLDAIEGHVFGVSLDNKVGMAVYTADVSEPGRGVNTEIRELALYDLKAAYESATVSKVTYLQVMGKVVHPSTMKAYLEICCSA